VCFYREGAEIAMGLCNRGRKSLAKKHLRLQMVKWTGNLQEWIPQTDDVVIEQASVCTHVSSCPAEYERADGSVYTVFPVFAAHEWYRIYDTFHPTQMG